MRGGSPRQQKPRYGACGGAFSAVCPYICPATNYPRAYTCSTCMHTHIHSANAFLVGQAQYRDVYTHYKCRPNLAKGTETHTTVPRASALILPGDTLDHKSNHSSRDSGTVDLNDGKDKRKYPNLFVFCYLPKNAIA